MAQILQFIDVILPDDDLGLLDATEPEFLGFSRLREVNLAVPLEFLWINICEGQQIWIEILNQEKLIWR